MKKQIYLAIAIILITMYAVSNTGIAQQSAEESPVTLEYKMKEGDLFIFKMSMGMKMLMPNMPGGMDLKMGIILKTIISQVSEDGQINQINLAHGEIIQAMMGGRNMAPEIPAESRENWTISRIKMRKEGGSIIEKTSSQVPTSLLELNKLLSPWVSFAGKEVKTGSTWTQTIKEETTNLATTYTLLGFETKGGYECAMIKEELGGTFNIEGVNATIEKTEGISYFAVKEGFVVSSNATGKFRMTPPGSQQDIVMDIDMQMQLQERKSIPPEKRQEVISSMDLLETGLGQINKKEYGSAEASLRDFLSRYKESPLRADVEKMITKTNEPLQDKMNRLRQQGNLEGMLILAQEAMKSGTASDKRMAQQELFWAYSQYNRTQELIPAYEKAMQENPDDPIACKMLGHVYMVQSDYAKAIELFEKAAALDSSDPDIQGNLGMAYQSNGMPEKAIDSFRKAIEIQPGRTDLYPQLAKAYVSAGKADESIKLADEIKQSIEKQKISGSEAFMQISLGDTYMEVKHYDEAIEAYKKAVELEPANERYFKDKLATAYEQAGKPDLAAEVRNSIQQPEFAQPGLPGKSAHSFALRDMEGKEVKIEDFKGKTVILDFWASWSPHCIKEIPNFIEFYNQYKDQGFAVIGISVDKGAEAVKAFVQKYKVNYPVLLDGKSTAKAYNVSTIPTTFIISKDGMIHKQYVGYTEKAVFEADIKSLLLK